MRQFIIFILEFDRIRDILWDMIFHQFSTRFIWGGLYMPFDSVNFNFLISTFLWMICFVANLKSWRVERAEEEDIHFRFIFIVDCHRIGDDIEENICYFNYIWENLIWDRGRLYVLCSSLIILKSFFSDFVSTVVQQVFNAQIGIFGV